MFFLDLIPLGQFGNFFYRSPRLNTINYIRKLYMYLMECTNQSYYLCKDISHSVFLYVNQIFSSTEPIFLEIRQAFASF